MISSPYKGKDLRPSTLWSIRGQRAIYPLQIQCIDAWDWCSCPKIRRHYSFESSLVSDNVDVLVQNIFLTTQACIRMSTTMEGSSLYLSLLWSRQAKSVWRPSSRQINSLEKHSPGITSNILTSRPLQMTQKKRCLPLQWRWQVSEQRELSSEPNEAPSWL